MTDRKTEKLRQLVTDLKAAANAMEQEDIQNGKICENLLLPLMIAFHAAAALLFAAGQQDQDWKDAIARFTWRE